MAKEEIFVSEASALNEGERKVFAVGKREVGVYRVNGQLYAYENHCAHQGGPACEGMMMPKVEEVLGEDKTFRMQRFNYDEWHIVCPWHAWEYDLKTGEFVVDRGRRLTKYEVIEKGGKIFIVA
jgi:nitrite reductase/ring-hydroxylating ferredoxin subunit